MGDKPGRPTIELLVVMLTATVCVVVVVVAVGIVVIETVNPNTDTSTGVTAVGAVTSTLFGAALGLLAGRAWARPSPPGG